jgi:putative holliday junction resolvase
VGSVRVGLARGSSLARLAAPLKTVPAGQAVDELAAMASDDRADAVVVGLPRGLNGQETAQTKAVRQWVEQAKRRLALPFYWQDEALSTAAVQGSSQSHGPDAAAAAVILQDFLDAPESDRVSA